MSDLIFADSGGLNLLFKPGDQLNWYPVPTAEPVHVELYMFQKDKPISSAHVVDIFAPGQQIIIPHNPAQDHDVNFFTISYSFDGTPSHSNFGDAFAETGQTLFRQRETDAPVIGQVGAATTESISIGVSSFTRFARLRRVTIANNSEMSNPLAVYTRDGSNYAARELPREMMIQRGAADQVATNFALAVNGGTASASSTHDGFDVASTNNGDRNGTTYWNDNNSNTFPDWLQIDFDQSRAITEIDVFGVQDSVGSPSAPTLSMTSTLYGLKDFLVQYWDGAAWQTITGGNITNNTHVWKQFTFPEIHTTKIRVYITATQDGEWSRVVEIEAWGLLNTALPQTIWITVEHSGGSVWGAASEPQAFTFAGGSEPGSESIFDPHPKDDPYLLN
jgi:hypothetical protein